MTAPRSLQLRLGLTIGLLLSVLWVATATVTAVMLRQEIDEVFDSALEETAQRLLPLAVMDVIDRDEEGVTQHLSANRDHVEHFTYLVTDAQGRILLQSHDANPADYPPWQGVGFADSATHRTFSDAALRDSIRITVAEPLDHRAGVAREVQMGLGLPILIVIPLTLLAIVLAVRASLAPLRRFRETLERRNERDMAPVPADDLPAELAPLAAAQNALLDRLRGAFEAERSFAANAAHELRTPLAGAIAQAQRLRAETQDPAAQARAADIETALKRLTRMSERLLQLARAEGGRLRLDAPADLRTAARVVLDDLSRAAGPGRIATTLPDTPVVSDLDPDAFGILCRNLVENALRHGDDTAPVRVSLSSDGWFRVSNAGPVVAPERLQALTARFERGDAQADGSGLGLAIASAIADRIGTAIDLRSPRPDHADGFEVALRLPVAGS